MVFVAPPGVSGILGSLKSAKRQHLKSVDAVLGLEETQYKAALKDGLVEEGKLFEYGPYAFIADTQRFPESAWPKTWKEVPLKLSKKVFIEDPRLSSTAMGWLRAIFDLKLIDAGAAKEVAARVFPSWSSAYGAFLKGEASVVWSYQSSEAYHRCNEKSDTDRVRYRAIPLEEGYPAQREFAAAVKGKSKEAKKFLDFLQLPAVQNAIAGKNWMFPALAKAQRPECFKALPSWKILDVGSEFVSKDLTEWTDRWSL